MEADGLFRLNTAARLDGGTDHHPWVLLGALTLAGFGSDDGALWLRPNHTFAQEEEQEQQEQQEEAAEPPRES